MVGGQKIQVGLAHARKTVQVTVGPDACHVAVETGITDLCPAGTFSAMLANVDDLDLLRHEFNAEDGSSSSALTITGSTATTPPRNDRVGSREATMTLESMTIWLTRF
jgi:hypothetical protein